MFETSDGAALEQLPFGIDPEPAFATITLSRCGELVAKVDYEFLPYAERFTWSLHRPNALKLYGRAERCPETGRRLRLYLHHLVAHVFDIKPGHPACTHLDHRNGDGLDCRRWNLVWRHPIDNRWGTARWGSTRLHASQARG